MARFMYGRNGADQLCWALFIAELVLSLLPALVPGRAFAAFIHYTTLFLCVYLLFRAPAQTQIHGGGGGPPPPPPGGPPAPAAPTRNTSM